MGFFFPKWPKRLVKSYLETLHMQSYKLNVSKNNLHTFTVKYEVQMIIGNKYYSLPV